MGLGAVLVAYLLLTAVALGLFVLAVAWQHVAAGVRWVAQRWSRPEPAPAPAPQQAHRDSGRAA